MKNVCICLVIAASITVSLVGCKTETVKLTSAPEAAKASYLDQSRTDLSSLGWLGATSHPVSEAFSFAHPSKEDKTVSPGGLVLTEVFSDTPAEKAGLKTGDVMVGVGERWLPINDDPTMDFIRELETEVSSGSEKIAISVMRDGACETVDIDNVVKPLSEGMPYDVARLKDAAARGADYLASQQNDDGSFGNETIEPYERLQVTAVCGLALLAADNDFQSNLDQCLKFIGETIDACGKEEDARLEAQKKVPEGIAILKSLTQESVDQKDALGDALKKLKDIQNKAVKKMPTIKIPNYNIEPSIVSYSLMFLAEANVPMTDGKWMPRIQGLIQSLAKAQDDSGAWGVASVQPAVEEKSEQSNLDEVAINSSASQTTNRVLLALGMMERKGISGNPETISKACGYLKTRFTERASESLDRRTKAGLAAGTTAALYSINCQPRDAFLLEATKAAMTKMEERVSINGGLSFAFETAVFARQSNKENWQQFHDSYKYLLSSSQKPDGSFASTRFPEIEPDSSRSEEWRTAHCCLLLSLQQGKLKKLIAETKGPMNITRDSDGKKIDAAQTAAGAQTPGGPELDKMEEMKKKFKELGIDIGNLKIPPPSGKK